MVGATAPPPVPLQQGERARIRLTSAALEPDQLGVDALAAHHVEQGVRGHRLGSYLTIIRCGFSS